MGKLWLCSNDREETEVRAGCYYFVSGHAGDMHAYCIVTTFRVARSEGADVIERRPIQEVYGIVKTLPKRCVSRG